MALAQFFYHKTHSCCYQFDRDPPGTEFLRCTENPVEPLTVGRLKIVRTQGVFVFKFGFHMGG